MDFDLSQTDHLLTTTRAVRKRLDLARPVPRELILDCVRISTQAPAGGNHQRWRWLIVDDPELKGVVADAYRRSYAPYIEAQRAAVAEAGNSAESNPIIDSSTHLAEVLHDVPVLAIPCALGAPPPVASDGASEGWWGSLLPAVWSYCLAARSRGLGTAWTTLHLPFADEVAGALGIPDTVTQLACIPTAFHTGDDFRPARRRAAEEVTYWNAWKATDAGS
ncbi:nitroreductase family protein [Ilumatobacter sp.]|uniref:nitroreductase family protein n=1 Tax=Ilumatobacter sp. TaxID=1967498 RepID=UPI003B520BD6